MSHITFQRRVNQLIKRAGGNLKVRFSYDNEHGIHMASFDDGTRILGNNVCKQVEIRWGSGHKAVATI